MSTSSCGQIRMSSCGQMRISNCRACLRHLSADARHAVQWCRRTGSPADKKGPSPAAQLCIGTGSSGKPRTLKLLWFKSGWVAGGWAALFEARRDLGVQPFFCVPDPCRMNAGAKRTADLEEVPAKRSRRDLFRVQRAAVQQPHPAADRQPLAAGVGDCVA